MMREEEEEEQTMHTTTTNTVHELRVIVRDARGMREEAPLRVHAKFDDEEKMTVSRVYLSFFVVCVHSRESLLTKEGAIDHHFLSLFPFKYNENRKRRDRRRTRNGTSS